MRGYHAPKELIQKFNLMLQKESNTVWVSIGSILIAFVLWLLKDKLQTIGLLAEEKKWERKKRNERKVESTGAFTTDSLCDLEQITLPLCTSSFSVHWGRQIRVSLNSLISPASRLLCLQTGGATNHRLICTPVCTKKFKNSIQQKNLEKSLTEVVVMLVRLALIPDQCHGTVHPWWCVLTISGWLLLDALQYANYLTQQPWEIDITQAHQKNEETEAHKPKGWCSYVGLEDFKLIQQKICVFYTISPILKWP